MFVLWLSKAPLPAFSSCVQSIFKFYSHIYISESEQQCLDLINLQDLFIHLFYLKLYFDLSLIHRQTEGWIYQSTNLRLGLYATYTLAPFTYGTKKEKNCDGLQPDNTVPHTFTLVIGVLLIYRTFPSGKEPRVFGKGRQNLIWKFILSHPSGRVRFINTSLRQEQRLSTLAGVSE